MKSRNLKKVLAGMCAVALTTSSVPLSVQAETETAVENNSSLRLWYDEPASKGKNILNGGNFGTTEEDNTWQQQTLPIGNSFMGANIYGEIGKERLTFNQKTLWNGGPSENRPDYNGGNRKTADNGKKMADVYKEVIELYKKGEDAKANELAKKLTGEVEGYGAYQSWGDIYVDFGFDEKEAENYVRDLNLENSVASVDFEYHDTKMHREYFVSYPDNVLVMKFTAIGGEKMDFDISFPIDNEEDVVDKKLGKEVTTTVKGNTITVAGAMQDNQLQLNGKVKVVTEDGKVQEKDGEKLHVSHASEAVVYVSADTDYLNSYPEYRTGETAKELDASVQKVVDKASKKGYEKVKEDHIADYSEIFSRVDLNLGQSVPNKTTDVLLNDYNAKKNTEEENRALEVMLFQYGRYLTISSSRSGDLPSNLQGVWQNRVGDHNRIPWASDYHMNVNLQMNYWPTYSTNMAECATPLIDYIKSLIEPGKVTAKTYFGVENGGFTAHTQNTPFGWTCPGWDFSWGWSPAALPWILQNCWEYYEYTGDVAYMEKNIYPLLKESALLYDQILIEDEKTGRLVSAPAYSPEHGPVTAGNTYEQSLIWQLYEDAATAAEVLGKDVDKAKEWRARQEKLKPIEIGDSGQIKEWYTETTLGSIGEKGHRHMSHLLGLFPGDLISVDNAKYMDAAIISLKERGEKSTGWGMGQRINAWARTGDGNQAHKLIQNLFHDGIYPNLWDTHSPFQIDGNFGMTSGVSEMLLQSNMGYINMLPSLPDVWANGSVQGLVARGNFEVNMKWADKNLTEASILSNNGGTATVQTTNASLATVFDEAGNPVDLKSLTADRISFETEKGKTYTIKNIPQKVGTPVDLTVNRIDKQTVELTWDKPEIAQTSFNVYRKVDNGDVQLIANNVKSNSYKDITAAEKLGTMQYQISAVVSGQESERTEFVSVKEVAVTAGMIDDTDSHILYEGAWGDWKEDVNYNGTIKYLNTPQGNESATLNFIGTGIEVITCTNLDRGKMEVLIDGESYGEVDTYSAQTKRQQKVFGKDDLSYGEHTITLKVLNQSSQGAGKSTKVELDAFRVLDHTMAMPSSVKVSTVSGITTIGKAESTIQMKAEIQPEEVQDKRVTWSSSDTSVAEVDENGLVTVKRKNGTVDITAVSKADATKSGKLTLKVALKQENESTITEIEDAVQKDGKWQPNPEITWSEGWSTWDGEADRHHGGTKTEATGAGKYFEYTFTGTQIEVYAQKHQNCGNLDIYLDREKKATCSFNTDIGAGEDQALLFQSEKLSEGKHTIKCVVVDREGKQQGNVDYLKVFAPAETAMVDKANLQDVITEASMLSKEAYPQDKWAEFEKVYQEAVLVMNKEDVEQKAVDETEKALTAAIKSLGKAQPPVIEEETGKAILVESQKIVLEWDSVQGAKAYEILDEEHQVKVETAETFVKVTGLNPGTTYNFKIYAINEGGKSEKAIQVANVTTTSINEDTTLPSITDIVKIVTGKDCVKLTWKAPAEKEVSGYNIYVDGVKKGTTKDTEFMLDGLVENQIYVVKIVAFSEEGYQSLPVQFAFRFNKEKEEQIVVSVTEPEGIMVEKGVPFEKLELPKSVIAQLESGLDIELSVKWQKGDYNEKESGLYELKGILELKDTLNNPNNVVACITVTVKSDIIPPDPDGNHNNGNPDANQNGDNGGNKKPDSNAQSGSNTQSNQKNPSKIVKTGDSAPIFLWSAVGICALAGFIFAVKKRKK